MSPKSTNDDYNQIWYTRCPVPAASGVAFQLGYLPEVYGKQGIGIEALQDAAPELGHAHFDHDLAGLIREGGNIPAIAARAHGAKTRLIGLTWIEEGQGIAVRPDSGINSPADLKGRRIGIQAWSPTPETSHPHGMGLHGFQQALRLAGLSFDDVEVVEVAISQSSTLVPRQGGNRDGSSFGVEDVASGRIDAIYGKGGYFAEEVARLGLVIAINLDEEPDLRHRVNNGTPRPITVHEQLLEERPDLVVQFLTESLRAADWAVEHPVEVRQILEKETGSGAKGIEIAHGPEFHLHLHPNLSDERLALFNIQKDFLYTHGFLRENFDLESWVAREPIEQAQAQLNSIALSV